MSGRGPVPRGRVLGAALAALLGLGGIVALTEALRHPVPGGAPRVPELSARDGDPRAETACDESLPREGLPRAAPGDDPAAAPVTVTSNELYDCPQAFDGMRVRYRGEVVGAVLRRDGGAWVQLNDDVYGGTLGPLPAHRDYRGGNAGVGVFVPATVADEITSVGGPQARGDVVEVVGAFNRVDAASAESSVIRAERGAVVVAGQPFIDPLLPERRPVAAVVLLLAAAMTVAERLARRRR